jgi:hypothetical protein
MPMTNDQGIQVGDIISAYIGDFIGIVDILLPEQGGFMASPILPASKEKFGPRFVSFWPDNKVLVRADDQS